MTFDDWRTMVKVAYQGGEPTRQLLLMAVKDYARSVMVRDVESDLALARSYQNSFNSARVKMAGARLTGTDATVLAEVKALMPIDADTDAMLPVLENAILGGRDDLDGTADKFDRHLLEAAIDLQRHIPFFQARQSTQYLSGGAGVTAAGFYSRVAYPEEGRIMQVWYGPYYPPLAAGTWAAEDLVVSNGRVYEVVVGGVLLSGDIGTGLQSTDGEDEELGSLTFKFHVGDRDWPVRAIDWNARQSMRAGQISGGPVYTVPPQQDEVWLYPALDADHRFLVEWVGVATTFEDDDEVTFDATAAKAAAQYIRAMMEKDELSDLKASTASLAMYMKALRESVLDMQDRELGTPPNIAPYDWSRRPGERGCGCGIVDENSNNLMCPVPNNWYEMENDEGDDILTAIAPNMTIDLEIGGDAGLRRFALATQNREPGDTLTVRVGMPLTAGIEFGFYDAAVDGTALLPALNFPSQTYTTDGVITSGVFEFVFNGSAWEYTRGQIPA